MNKLILIFFVILMSCSVASGQDKYKDRDKESRLPQVTGIVDRAGGTHNGSNIGLFFENRGKLYPRRVTQGPSGEWPINSTMHYIYRINPMVGIPGNVIQGRYTENEEWEAIGGYHNPEISSIALSDNPRTWHPTNGWPVQDADGNPLIKSDQDSYVAYNDSNNTKSILGIEVIQTGYTYGVKFAENIIFFKYQIVNKGFNDLSGLYFALYNDIDVGNISGGDPEYGDDFIGYDKEENFLYFHDDGISNEWPGGKTGHFGIAFLETPTVNGTPMGVTDMHYNLYYDDQDIDSVQYGIMSSSSSLYNSDFGDRYFHIGNNQDRHFDDPATIPQSGLDLVATMSSGPYNLNAGDTLTFVTAILAGSNLTDIYKSLDASKTVVGFNFEISKPPSTPTLTSVPGDGAVTLYWDDAAENSMDNFSGEYDFEGYRLYRSQDKGVTWTQLLDYDIINFIGFDTGLQYSYVDNSVTNGFEYWYSMTAYDRGDSTIASLESPKGSSPDLINLAAAIPRSKALGFIPVSTGNVQNIGTGNSNYILKVDPTDNDLLGGNQYEIGFDYLIKKEKGNFDTQIEIIIRDSAQTFPTSYGVEFLPSNQITIIDLLTGEYLDRYPRNFISGGRYNVSNGLQFVIFDPDPNADPALLPQTGDYMTVKFGTLVMKNGSETIMPIRPFLINQNFATSDGVLFSISPPELIEDVSRIGGTDPVEITFAADDETLFQNNTYIVSIENNGVDESGNQFVTIIVRDDSQNIIAALDNVYDLDDFYFNGVRGRINFNSSSVPSAGNIFSVTTILPMQLTLKDRFLFDITASRIDRENIKENISEIRVVPNPYIVSSLYEPEFGELRQEPLRQIQFINLPNECTIHIYTIDADLVKTIYHSSTNGTSTWDLRAEGGREIAPGIYIYVVKTEGVEHISRFAIIK